MTLKQPFHEALKAKAVNGLGVNGLKEWMFVCPFVKTMYGFDFL